MIRLRLSVLAVPLVMAMFLLSAGHRALAGTSGTTDPAATPAAGSATAPAVSGTVLASDNLQDQYTWTPDKNPSPSEFLRTAGKLYIPEGQWQNVFQVTDNATAGQMQIAAANRQQYQILFPVVAADLDKIAWIEKLVSKDVNTDEIYGTHILRSRDNSGPIHLRDPLAVPNPNNSSASVKYYANIPSGSVKYINGSLFAMDFRLFNSTGNERFLSVNPDDGKVILTEYQLPLDTITIFPDNHNMDPNKNFQLTDINSVIATVPNNTRLPLNLNYNNYHNLFSDYDVVVDRFVPAGGEPITSGEAYSLFLDSPNGQLITTDITP